MEDHNLITDAERAGQIAAQGVEKVAPNMPNDCHNGSQSAAAAIAVSKVILESHPLLGSYRLGDRPLTVSGVHISGSWAKRPLNSGVVLLVVLLGWIVLQAPVITLGRVILGGVIGLVAGKIICLGAKKLLKH